MVSDSKLNEQGKGDRINIYQFICVLIWTAYAPRDEKIKCIPSLCNEQDVFKMFDFDSNGTFSLLEMQEIFASTIKGIGALTKIEMPKKRDLRIASKMGFSSADANNDCTLQLEE